MRNNTLKVCWDEFKSRAAIYLKNLLSHAPLNYLFNVRHHLKAKAIKKNEKKKTLQHILGEKKTLENIYLHWLHGKSASLHPHSLWTQTDSFIRTGKYEKSEKSKIKWNKQMSKHDITDDGGGFGSRTPVITLSFQNDGYNSKSDSELDVLERSHRSRVNN